MLRAEKEQLVASLNETFNAASVVVVTHYTGLNAGQMTDLRSSMRAAGANFRVTKNRLTRIALEGTPYQGLSDMFVGPTAIAFSDDPVTAAKASVEFAKKNEKLVILGGALGETLIDEAGVKALASLPPIDELRGKIVGLLNAPASRLARVINAPGSQLARVLNAYATKDEAA
ncbi:MAG: 50S ribosomal protein L10 [Rhodospirillaceae bacterium]|nr:50S ribosomal protein L10 [Rhodospirillaceae bacterium]|tara:strand:+ start:165 stop:683 length:519 start_codon:yes stop_codon:yes gene_type:complete